MILNFDVDCGELIPGHHFIARGLGGLRRLSISDFRDVDCDEDVDGGEYELLVELEEAGGYPGFSLEYELVPGVSAVEAEGDGGFFRFLVGIDYDADVKLPWHPNDGGAIAPFRGGDATHGSRGYWPLPPDASVLTFSIAGVTAGGFADRENPAGDLVVDLARGDAVWRPR
jgi:hypothetical protein